MSVAEIEAKVAAAIDDDERRAARARYRAAGGSHRRPLKSFTTTREAKANRREHADELAAAIEAIVGDRTGEGIRDWLASLILNPDLSALNCALVASRLGPVLAATPAQWHKRGGYSVAKGSTAAAFVTAPGFKRRPVFTADQVGASDLVAEIESDPPRLPTDEQVWLLADALRARLSGAGKPSKVVAAFGDEIRSDGVLEGCSGREVFGATPSGGSDDVIPF